MKTRPASILFLLFGCLFGHTVLSYAQCCNILASTGSYVLTTDGACVTLTYPDESCLGGSDKDGDGIKDSDDLCPDTKGTKQNSGCPEITVEIWTSFYIALSDVNFAVDSDSIRPSSYSSLEKIGDLMKANKGFTLKLGGYADSTGTQEHNKKLSEARAKAVRDYLLEHEKVNAKRIRLASYGEKMPKAPNTTASGRAINRRVEFDLFY